MPDTPRSEPPTPEPGMRRMLRDFGRALSDAISESGEAASKLREIRERGYALYLLLDTSGEGEAAGDRGAQLGTGQDVDRRGGVRAGGQRRLQAAPTERRTRRSEGRIEAAVSNRRAEREPQFRINGTDLSFLRSIGIDPTRPQRRRRS